MGGVGWSILVPDMFCPHQCIFNSSISLWRDKPLPPLCPRWMTWWEMNGTWCTLRSKKNGPQLTGLCCTLIAQRAWCKECILGSRRCRPIQTIRTKREMLFFIPWKLLFVPMFLMLPLPVWTVWQSLVSQNIIGGHTHLITVAKAADFIHNLETWLVPDRNS